MTTTPRMNAAMTSNERYRVGCELEAELARMTVAWETANREGDETIEERDALLAENKWHKVSERMPPYNVHVMTFGACGIITGMWDCNKWYTHNPGDDSMDEWLYHLPTHWRKFPQPPKEAGK